MKNWVLPMLRIASSHLRIGNLNGLVMALSFLYETHIRQTKSFQWTSSCPGLAANTTIAPHGPLSSSTMPLLFRPSQIFRITGASLNPYLGILQHTGSAAPVSTINWKPMIGLRSPSCANTSQKSLMILVMRILLYSLQPSQLEFFCSSL